MIIQEVVSTNTFINHDYLLELNLLNEYTSPHHHEIMMNQFQDDLKCFLLIKAKII